MSKFLFQPDPINGYEFNPIPLDIHLGVIKIPTHEIIDDFKMNLTEVVIIGTDRGEVLDSLQKAFTRLFDRCGRLKESDIETTDYDKNQT